MKKKSIWNDASLQHSSLASTRLTFSVSRPLITKADAVLVRAATAEQFLYFSHCFSLSFYPQALVSICRSLTLIGANKHIASKSNTHTRR